MNTQPLGDNLTHGHARRQGPVGVLKHHLQLVAILAHSGAVQPVNPVALIDNPPLGRQQLQQRTAQRGFTRAGLSHHPDGLPLAQRQRDSIHRAQGRILGKQPRRRAKGHAHIVTLQQHRRTIGHRRLCPVRLRRQQHLGIIRLRIAKDVLRRPFLLQQTLTHHVNPVGKGLHDGQIMRDKQNRHAQPRLQFGQQLQDFRLNRHIQRGCRLIRDQQIGVIGQRHGDHHTLPLPARHLMRIGPQLCLGVGDLHQRQQLQRTGHGRLNAQPAMHPQRLGQLIANAIQRVQ